MKEDSRAYFSQLLQYGMAVSFCIVVLCAFIYMASNTDKTVEKSLIVGSVFITLVFALLIIA
jgi:hypothetical protein